MHCLIVDDHPIALLGLSLVVKDHFPEWRISTATTVQDAISTFQSASREPIGLAIVDWVVNDQNGFTFLEYLRQCSSSSPTYSIVVSDAKAPNIVDLCKAHGANGFIPKRTAQHAIAQAIDLVSSGKEYFAQCDKASSHASIQGVGGEIKLTERQRDVLDLVLAGYSNKKIADTLNISYGTAKNYMFDLMRLVSTNSRLELAIKIRESNYQPRRKICGTPLLPVEQRQSPSGTSWTDNCRLALLEKTKPRPYT